MFGLFALSIVATLVLGVASFAGANTQRANPDVQTVVRRSRLPDEAHAFKFCLKLRESGAAAAFAILCPMDDNSWLCLLNISNCCRACCDQSSINCAGSLVRANSRAKSKNMFAFVCAISIIFKWRSRTPSAVADKLSCAACAVCSVAALPLFKASRVGPATTSVIFLPFSN